MESFFIRSAALIGLEARRVDVEVDITGGMPSCTIVGLPDTAVSESRERVRAAIKNSGFSVPRARITINLAPADVKKQGTVYDVPIALAILCASGEITREHIEGLLFYGELALNGSLRPVPGVLLCASHAKDEGLRGIIVARENAAEASLIEDLPVYSVRSLRDLVERLKEGTLRRAKARTLSLENPANTGQDMAHIKGQEFAKRALEVAAAGGHNVLLSGPPGSGKTMLARTIPTILPPLTTSEALEVTKIHSVAGLTHGAQLVEHRPFRAPHHSASAIALIGGGTWPKPGEVSLAHRGVLFLDEFPEFSRHTIEHLRQPLEDGNVAIARAAGSVKFPAKFMLVATMNPCPCGFQNDKEKQCICSPSQAARYAGRVSGPMLDRIDLFVQVPRIPFDDLTQSGVLESSAQIRERVCAARAIQRERFLGTPVHTNSEASSAFLPAYTEFSNESQALLKKAVEQFSLSARAYNRLLKISRTIADLEGAKTISASHLREALHFRQPVIERF